MLSVIIPALNENKNLRRLLPDLGRTCPRAEVILADGGSSDGTLEAVRQFPQARLVRSRPGRARQMNAGARASRGDVLLFLHADTHLPAGAQTAILEACRDPAVVGGRFDVQFDNPRPAFRMIAALMNLRSRLSGIFTGDQGIFVRREVFEALGGYPDLPLMEDVEFTRRLKRKGRLACLRLRVTTSARKWEREGVLRTILLMWALRCLYFLGVAPERLHRMYYPQLSSDEAGNGPDPSGTPQG